MAAANNIFGTNRDKIKALTKRVEDLEEAVKELNDDGNVDDLMEVIESLNETLQNGFIEVVKAIRETAPVDAETQKKLDAVVNQIAENTKEIKDTASGS